ncbi:MAG: MSCRAMM family protein [Planctomycetota bacterium]|jgi:hypothetical protein
MKWTAIGVLVLTVFVAAYAAWWAASEGEERAERSATRSEESAAAPVVAREGEETREAHPEELVTPVAEEAAEAPTAVRGRVVAEGRPVEGVRIYVIRGGSMVGDAMATGPDGTFEFPWTGELTVGAAHETYGPVIRTLSAPEGEVTEVELELAPGNEVGILVLDQASGEPVAEARVFLLRAGDRKTFEGVNAQLGSVFTGEEGPEDIDFAFLSALTLMDLMGAQQQSGAVWVDPALTDGMGRARLTGLPEGTVDVIVTHPDYMAGRITGKPIQLDRALTVRLGRGGGLTVIAPRVEGKIAEGYFCTVQKGGMIGMLPAGMKNIGPEGKAVFEHLAPGDYRVSVGRSAGILGGVAVDVEEEAMAEDESAAADEEMEEEPSEFGPPLISRAATVVADRMTVLDLSREEGATIEATVLVGGKPVESGWAFVMSGENFSDQRGMVEFGDGKFRIENLEPGRYRVIAAADQGGSGQAELEIREGDRVVTLEIRMGMGKVTGRVLSQEGKPVPGAGVLVLPAERQASPTRHIADLLEAVLGQADADGKGEFEIEGVGAGRYRVLCGFKGSLLTKDLTLREGEEAHVDFRFDPQRLHRLTVRLKDGTGEPVEGQVVLMGAGGGLAEAIALSSGDEEDMMMGTLESTHQFQLAPGTYRFSASAEGFAKVLGSKVELNRDREVTVALQPGVEVRLEIRGPSGPITGSDLEVRSQDGFPVGTASTLFEVIFQPKSLRTDARGVVSLPRLPPGRYTVHLGEREVGSFRVGDRPVAKIIEVTR